MENPVDFVRQLQDVLDEKGVIVIDNVTAMPAYNMNYVQPYYTISINHCGSVEGLYESNDFVFSRHDISVLYPGHTIYIQKSSPDYCASLIIISDRIYSQLNFINTSDNRFLFETEPHFRLADRQYAEVLSIVEVFRVINGLSHVNRNEMHATLLEVFMSVIVSFRIENVGKGSDGKNRISPLLYDAINMHCHQHHDVEFYADLFCLSPKHFSAVVKRETGYGASHWIQQQIVADAKSLLRTEHQTSIQEISDRIGFPDLATFSRFFKRQTGMTPSAFRQSL